MHPHCLNLSNFHSQLLSDEVTQLFMDRAALRKLDSSGKVAIATIADSILPALNVPDEKADWGYLLVMNDYHKACKATQISSTSLTPLTI